MSGLTPQHLDAWRIIPRALIITYMIVFYQSINWFMALEDPNNAQAGFISVIVGAGAAWFGLYVNSRSNNNLPAKPIAAKPNTRTEPVITDTKSGKY